MTERRFLVCFILVILVGCAGLLWVLQEVSPPNIRTEIRGDKVCFLEVTAITGTVLSETCR